MPQENNSQENNITNEIKEESKYPVKKKKKHFFHGYISSQDSYFKKYISILIGFLDTMIIDNIFFIICSIPIISIGPALLALASSILDINENKIEKRYRKYFFHFKEHFNLKIIIFGLIVSLSIASLSYTILLCYINLPNFQFLIIIWVLATFLLLYVVNFASFFILMYLKMDVDFKTVVSNSFKLSAGSIKSNLLCDLAFIVAIILPLIFLIRAFFILILLSFSFTLLSCLMAVYPTVDKYLIYPYEKYFVDSKKDEDESKLNLDNKNNTNDK